MGWCESLGCDLCEYVLCVCVGVCVCVWVCVFVCESVCVCVCGVLSLVCEPR